jgi:septum formation topological specificity factor MinE
MMLEMAALDVLNVLVKYKKIDQEGLELSCLGQLSEKLAKCMELGCLGSFWP